MAPKKKPGKKGGAKSSGKKKGVEGIEETGPVDEVTELDRHHYLSQIESLSRQLQAIKSRCSQLEAAEEQARSRHDQLLQDKVDVTAFLRDRLRARSNEAEELRSRLLALMTSREEERTAYELRLKEQEKSTENQQLDLNDRLIALTRQLDSLEEFRQNKEQLEERLHKLETTLESERKQAQEKTSILERAAIVEAEALRGEVEHRVAGLASRFRRAAAAEMHSTTRRALHHNQALTSVLATLRTRLLHLREENHRMRDSLQEATIQKKVQADSIVKLASHAQKRADLLAHVTEKAEQFAKQHQQYAKLLKEADQLRKDLRLQQAQLDATTELTSQLKEKATERDIALELTSARLLQEDAIKRSLLSTIRYALHILQRATFQEETNASTESDDANMTKQNEITESSDDSTTRESLFKQLIELLTAEEAKALAEQYKQEPGAETGFAPDPLLTYSSGDLGLLPRVQRKNKTNHSKH